MTDIVNDESLFYDCVVIKVTAMVNDEGLFYVCDVIND